MDLEDFFVAFLLPVSVTVILPVSIVLIISLANKLKYRSRFSFLEKCVENGVEIKPELLMDDKKKNISSVATLKTMLINRLVAGIILSLLGSCLLIWTLLHDRNDVLTFAVMGMLTIGIGLIIWFVIGKKMLSEDIADAKQNLSAKTSDSTFEK